MGAIFPDTNVHATFVLGEIEVNPNSHGEAVENMPPYQGILCLYIFLPDIFWTKGFSKINLFFELNYLETKPFFLTLMV